MIGFLTTNLWKAATAGATIVALGLGVALVQTKLDLREMTADRNTLHTAIYAERTGWSARLNQCQTNNRSLSDSLTRQNDALREQAAKSAAKLSEAAAGAAAARREGIATQARIGQLMQQLVGIDSCARMYEVDKRVLESLRK